MYTTNSLTVDEGKEQLNPSYDKVIKANSTTEGMWDSGTKWKEFLSQSSFCMTPADAVTFTKQGRLTSTKDEDVAVSSKPRCDGVVLH